MTAKPKDGSGARKTRAYPQNLTATPTVDEVNGAAIDLDIKAADRENFARWIRSAISRFNVAKDAYDSACTKREKYKVLSTTKRHLDALVDLLSAPWVEGYMVSHECGLLSDREHSDRVNRGYSAAIKWVRRDLRALHLLSKRVDQMIAREATRNEDELERSAAKSASLPAHDLLAKSTVAFFGNRKRRMILGKKVSQEKFTRVIFRLAEGHARDVENTERIKSWIKKAKRSKSDLPRTVAPTAVERTQSATSTCYTIATWSETFIRMLVDRGLDRDSAAELANELGNIDLASDPVRAATRVFIELERETRAR